MTKKTKHIRTIIQVFFFALVGLIAFNHTLSESGQSISFLGSASVHAICPFGGVETLYQLFTTGGYIQKIHSATLILMGIAFTLAILFGPVICGWVCPIGSIQEWIGTIGKRIFGVHYNQFMPKKLDRVLRYLRYILLGLVLYNTARSGLLLFTNVDPYFALFHFWTGETAVAALVILGVTLALSLVVERPWCKYACPYGALLGLTNPIRIFKIRRQASTCIDCGNCDRACPMNIEVSTKAAVTDHQCISCMQCTSEDRCPIEKTVALLPRVPSSQTPKKSLSISRFTLGLLTLILMFGGIAATSALGVWSTESEKIPVKYNEGEAKGSYNPADIRGSYTFKEISDLFGIEQSVLREAFLIPETEDLAIFKSKNLEALYADAPQEIGNSSVQVFVALYNNLPIDLGDEYLLEPAVKLILAHNLELTEEQKSYLQTHTVKLDSKVIPVTETAPVASTTTPETSTTEPAINGQSTFQSALDLGITEAQIETIINAKMPATNVSIRSYCQENGLSFSEVKAALSALLE